MGETEGSGRAAFEAKLNAFLAEHGRIIEEFERSIESAAHFLKLAFLSREAEPAQTLAMLRQMRGIAMGRQLGVQQREFERLAGLLLAVPAQDGGGSVHEQIARLRRQYEHLVGEAGEQDDEIERLIGEIEHPR